MDLADMRADYQRNRLRREDLRVTRLNSSSCGWKRRVALGSRNRRRWVWQPLGAMDDSCFAPYCSKAWTTAASFFH